MSNIKVSIIVPVYNAEKYLEQCLNSLMNQTLKEIEIICVNDGSTDNSLEILNKFATKDFRIKIISQVNSGPSKARNTGIDNAQGQYLGFCDSDDYVDLTYYETLFNFAIEKNADVSSGYILVQSGNSFKYTSYPASEIPSTTEYITNQEKLDILYLNYNICACKHIMRKTLIYTNNIRFDNNIHRAEDQLFNFHVFYYANKVAQIPYYNSPKYYYCCARGQQLKPKQSANYKKLSSGQFEVAEIIYNFLDTNVQNCDDYLTLYKYINLVINDAIKNFPEYSNYATQVLNKFENKIIANYSFYPAFETNNIPVVFSSNNFYAPYLSVAIQSIIANSTKNNNYDIIILETGINSSNKTKLLKLSENLSNISIRFCQIDFLVSSKVHLFQISSIFTVETYYRIFIPYIFKHYSKILYFDCDITVLSDIAELYETDLKENLLGASIDYIGVSHGKIYPNIKEYFEEKLSLQSFSKYFQAGILIFNIPELIKFDFTEKCFEKLREIGNPMWVDQDILNSVCYNKIKYFGSEWNCCWHGYIDCPELALQALDEDELKNWYYSKEHVKIVHYCSRIKPWHALQNEMAEHFWHYARQTPFYEEILFKNISRIESTKSNDLQASSNETSKLKYYKISQIFPFLRIVQQDNTKKFMLWRFIPVRKVVFDANKVHKYLFGIKYKTVETGQNITSNDNYVKTYSLAQVFPFLRIVEENNTRKFMLWRFIPVRKVVFDGDKVHKYLFGIKYKTIKS